MTLSALLDFLRRELAPTPGRGSATFRLTLACLAATIPILIHHIPHALLVMIIMYLITREDTAATLIGSILGVIGITIGLGLALLDWKISLDIEWLRLSFFPVFIFGGLFLKRVLTIGALGSAIGLPAALVMILPDILPPSPEVLVEFVLWLWWCMTLGLLVNAVVQFLLSPGDPLILLQRELDMRLQAVEQLLRRLAGSDATAPASTSLSALEIAGMSRPLALLKTAAMIHPWARERHEGLAALITLVDRLVTSAVALEVVAQPPREGIRHERLLSVADRCHVTRRAFEDMRLPAPGEWAVLPAEQNTEMVSPLIDIERTLDEIALAVPGRLDDAGASGAVSAGKRSLLLPDAFDNPEYVRFAIKGTLAALICYVLFIGFDYPGIYTSVITCFVVSLSTIGASNQKGLLRFGGAAVGSLMGLIALVYLFPNVEGIGGFWLVFGAGTAAAAWVNFGSPRLSYGGYQIGLAFYKAILQDFGPALSALVVRDRWSASSSASWCSASSSMCCGPCALKTRCARAWRSSCTCWRSWPAPAASRATPTVTSHEVDVWRRRISQKVADVQELIESSKFELGDVNLREIQQLTGDAQVIFILLLSLARQGRDVTPPYGVRTAVVELESVIATALQALETRAAGGSKPAVPELEDALHAVERSMTGTDALDPEATAHLAGRLALYRTLVAAIKRLDLESLQTGEDGHRSLVAVPKSRHH